MTETPGYAPSFRIIHWVIAVLVFAVWPLGMLLKYFRDDVKLDFYMLHESFGFLVLWCMLLRLGMRWCSNSLPARAKDWTGKISLVVHVLLYIALIIMPVSGFLATNAHGFPLQWFGFIPIWSPLGRAPAIAPYFSILHTVTAWAILVLVCLHITGALFHRIIRRDDTFQRMM